MHVAGITSGSGGLAPQRQEGAASGDFDVHLRSLYDRLAQAERLSQAGLERVEGPAASPLEQVEAAVQEAEQSFQQVLEAEKFLIEAYRQVRLTGSS